MTEGERESVRERERERERERGKEREFISNYSNGENRCAGGYMATGQMKPLPCACSSSTISRRGGYLLIYSGWDVYPDQITYMPS